MTSRRGFLSGAAALAVLSGAGRSGAAPSASGKDASAETETGAVRAPGGQDASAETETGAVRARVLGIAQDGGLPHLGCRRACCVAARRDPAKARRVASLGLWCAGAGPVILVDATPDHRAQVDDLRQASGIEEERGKPVDRILLTHAHVGHYAGLIHLGREAMAADRVPVTATPRMCAFLEANKPWSRLVEWGHVGLEKMVPGSTARIAPSLSVTAIPAPHRDEDSDTVGFLFVGPSRSLLYLPDTDAWDRWARPVEELLERASVALLDGTFFGPDDLPGRDLSQIPHPFVRDSMKRFERIASRGRAKIWFTHLNHTNPGLVPGSQAAREIAERGFGVAEEGMELAL